jgi:hypothetical protein|tara:strand:+ start:1003 stop:1191 length:189 start_codon:yes stop_codon:yes gene_type:complete
MDKPAKFDLTPSWEATLFFYGEIIANGTEEGRYEAIKNLKLEGRKVDKMVARLRELDEIEVT